MNTDNDYLFALQLQNNLVDLSDDRDTLNHHVDLTKFASSSNVEIDLTNLEANRKADKKPKRGNTDFKSIANKRLCYENQEATGNLVDISWETLDPNPDIHGLFLAFNKQYFWGALSSVVIQWSKRMTVCAGLCRYASGFCSISLSEPLLKLRPRKDLVETLLHEMIHAYLFITNNRNHRDRDGHGADFCKHMYRINMEAGTNISIYHNFHDEVKLYQQHWWKCNGPCQYNKPFFGYVKRSMNRAPGPYDRWWANHKAICSGVFIKVKEPEGYGMKKKVPPVSKQTTVKSVNKITNFIKILGSPTKIVSEDNVKSIETNQQKEVPQSSNVENASFMKVLDTPTKKISKDWDNQDSCLENVDEITLCPVCNDSVLADWLNSHLQNCSQLKKIFGHEIEDMCNCPACNEKVSRSSMNDHLDGCKMLNNVFEDDSVSSLPDNINYVNCPNCDKMINESNINEHLDICLSEESPKPDDVNDQFKCPSCGNVLNGIFELDDHIDNCPSLK